MEIVKKIKRDNKPSLKEYFLSSYLISQRISPYLSSVYIKAGTSPNTITLYMIISGIIGAIFFSLPNIYLKIVGAILIQMWFILDCSDGEVARYTHRYSKFGKELDYMAHLINHPLFGISFFFSLAQLGRYNPFYLLIIIFSSNLFDYLNRNIISLLLIVDLKTNDPNNTNDVSQKDPNQWTMREMGLFLLNIFILYPNIILFGVIFYFVDISFNTNIFYIYLILNAFFTFINCARVMIDLTKKFYLSH